MNLKKAKKIRKFAKKELESFYRNLIGAKPWYVPRKMWNSIINKALGI